MALDLERQREVAAEVDDARVLARPLEHVGRPWWAGAQEDARVLVGAVLGPERGEEPELGEGRLPIEPPDDAIVLLGREAVAEGQIQRDLRLGTAVTPPPTPACSTRPIGLRNVPSSTRLPRSEWKISIPSVPPIADLGRPLRMRHQPEHRAFLVDDSRRCCRSEPFGLASLVTRPPPSQYRKTIWFARPELPQGLRLRVVLALPVRDRHLEHLARPQRRA